MSSLRYLLVLTALSLAVAYLFQGSSSSTTTVLASPTVDREWAIDINAGRAEFGSVTLHDIDDDGFDEIIFGTTSKGSSPAVGIMEHTGTIKWLKSVPHSVEATPTIADISFPPDGIPEIIIAMGPTVGPPGTPGSIFAFNRDGDILWEYKTTDAQNTNNEHGNRGTPQVGDVDNDGDMEIVFGSWDRNIYLLDHNGNYVWHYHVADTVWATGVLLDVNNNGYLEYITGTDITGGGTLPDGYMPTDGGFILVLDKDGTLLARRQLNETMYSSLAAGDVDGDGDYEFFTGTGHAFYDQGKVTQPHVYGFDIDQTPEAVLGYDLIWEIDDLPGWPRPVAYPGMSSPGLANLDNDADLEIFIGSGQDGGGEGCSASESDPSCYGALYAWDPDGSSLPGFPMWPEETNGKNWYIRSSPTAGDIDNDGEVEILFTIGWEIIIVGSDGVQEEALHSDYSLFNSPAIVDLDQDGRTNLITIGSSLFNNGNQATMYNFELEANTFDADALHWPTFRRDSANTGVVENVTLGVSPQSIFRTYDTAANADIDVALTIESVGAEATFDWEVTTPAGISASSTTGTVSNSSPDTVTLTIDTAGLPDGLNNLGNVVVSTTSGNVSNGPIEIPVTLFVGDISESYLPLTTK